MRHEVDLLSLADESVSTEHFEELAKLCRQVRVVSVSRLTKFFRLMRSLITGKSLTEGYFSSAIFSRALSDWQSQSGYDVCVAVCSSMGALAIDAKADRKLLVDFVDVDSVKWRNVARSHGVLTRWIYNRESRRVAKLERELVRQADRCVTVSERECDALLAVSLSAESLAIPNGVDIEYFSPGDKSVAKGVDKIDRLLFVGQMDYWPNASAVVWFAENVWPKLARRNKDLRWDIVGRNPSRAVRELGKLENVRVTGGVEDVRPYFASAIAIAPIDLSFGVQNKVLEAMAMGRPVVASSAVAGGVSESARSIIFIADSAEQWIAAIEKLLAQPELAEQTGRQGREVMVDEFSWERAEELMLWRVENMDAVMDDCR